jgi:predicted phosphodiesterase
LATVGVIADVHGNLEALTAVLAALAREGPERVVCLGDLVGYNAEPNECVALIRQRGIDCIAGNHDLMALERLGFERCSMRPEFAIRRTRRALTADSRRFLAALPADRSYQDQAVVLIHGGVDDVCEYVRTPDQVAAGARRLRARYPGARVCFFGHTHEPGVFTVAPDGSVRERPGGAGAVRLPRDQVTFVNPGSVDAARRTRKRAQFAVFDPGEWTVVFHDVGYDHVGAEARAARGGYRMTATDEAAHAARQLLRRGRRRATAVARALLGRRQ